MTSMLDSLKIIKGDKIKKTEYKPVVLKPSAYNKVVAIKGNTGATISEIVEALCIHYEHTKNAEY